MTILDQIIDVVKKSGAITLQDMYHALPHIDQAVIRGTINRYVKREDSFFKRCHRGVYVVVCEDPENIISLSEVTPIKRNNILKTFKKYVQRVVMKQPVFEVKMAAGSDFNQLSLFDEVAIEMNEGGSETSCHSTESMANPHHLIDSPYHSIPTVSTVTREGMSIEEFDDKVFQEDSRDFLKHLPDESIDLIVTDPPYPTSKRGRSKKTTSGGMFKKDLTNKGKIFEHNSIKPNEYIPELFRVLKEGTHCYIMTNHKNLVEMLNTSIASGFKFIKSLIWDKGNKIMGQLYMSQYEYILFFRKGSAKRINECGTSDILSVPNKKTKENGVNLHDTEKPIELMKTLVRNSSQVGERVLDPFLGIGATAIAAKELGRIFIGNELDETYHTIATKRLDEATILI